MLRTLTQPLPKGEELTLRVLTLRAARLVSINVLYSPLDDPCKKQGSGVE